MLSLSLSAQTPPLPLQNWVLCRIFLKRTTSNRDYGNSKERRCRPVFYDFLAHKSAGLKLVQTSSTSTATSGITELSSANEAPEEDTTSCNSLPHFRRKP